ncbi:MAG: universal stress protein [Novosphingobium sp.]|jgi:nucleotide-binding universal stress UspA family protein|nr:universal stress protein [Novosphingobium sp.]
MRSILVYADRSPAMSARLETALALARAGDGHITLLVDTPITRYISMDPMGGSYVASDAMKQALADDDGQAARLRAQIREAGLSYDVIRSEDEPVEALAVASRLADVVIVSRASAVAGEVVLATRTPVLVLANDRALPVPVARACVAWDGGNEAAAALRGSIPLLARCASVHVLSVGGKPGGYPAEDAVRYLARHSIHAEPRQLARKGSTEETLAAAVLKIGGDLLIMGAYGHSRMREFLFGGVTRYFLEDCPRPALLMAH